MCRPSNHHQTKSVAVAMIVKQKKYCCGNHHQAKSVAVAIIIKQKNVAVAMIVK
jgi:hypothetical protein